MDLYAVVGHPISHSKSPFIHAEFAKQTHQIMQYIKIEVPLDQFSNFVHDFQRRQGKGLNITLPFKQQAYQLASVLSDRARLAKAVNTLTFDNNEIYGDNTDGVGWIKDIVNNHHFSLTHKKILILGAGGAVRGILPLLSHYQPKCVMIANRTIENAETLAAEFQSCLTLTASGLGQIEGQYDLIINGTSSALTGAFLTLPESILSPTTFCYDLMYAKTLTPFLKWAKSQGINHLADGLGMLVEQAAESFFIWRGIKPNTKAIIARLASCRR